MEPSLKCAIVDDEYLAREYIKDYIHKLSFVELKGDFNSPLKVMDLLKKGEVDLLFLDIEMPDLSGLDFLKTLDQQPYIVITTAYSDYALEGYELNISDYLLKPFSFSRFLKAVNKVSEAVEKDRKLSSHTARRAASNDADSPRESAPPDIYDDYLIVRADRKYYKINYEDLIYIEGQKAYVTFHTENKKITALFSLKELEEQLPSDRFVRIHKSYIISVRKLSSLEGNMVEIADQYLPIGRTYRYKIEELFGL
ncbi:LytR/AlgR family response regulator transcription factor [Gracilimonas mengyeensis]|uniref:Two component transcriptional regulator, LytTR family n=1 Tax=Gracilimonas mengyeensis TaxID=1302730 RepID=A0A521BX86_9BACT|nr:LytTR family DNA-binding domain-containing protein [Gracilimonas mengyeensis]SMO51070.1 two component transcriptional regulator, LytTR family [Gracilimonas mengyeensis]